MGCHGNHVFSHSPYLFIFRTTLLRTLGVPMNNLAPMRNYPVVQGRLNWMPWYNVGHVVRLR